MRIAKEEDNIRFSIQVKMLKDEIKKKKKDVMMFKCRNDNNNFFLKKKKKRVLGSHIEVEQLKKK